MSAEAGMSDLLERMPPQHRQVFAEIQILMAFPTFGPPSIQSLADTYHPTFQQLLTMPGMSHSLLVDLLHRVGVH